MLGKFIGHAAHQRLYCDSKLLFIRLARRNALHPQTRGREDADERIIMLTRVHQKLISETDDKRQQRELDKHTQQHIVPRNERQRINED